MVTYRIVRDDARDVYGGNYWHIPGRDLEYSTRSDLKAKLDIDGVPFKASATKARLIELTRRSERGLIGYDHCGTQELLKFLKQRGNSTKTQTRPSRAAMISTLEQMDDDATFHKFNDLPPELRVRVDAVHLDWIAENHQKKSGRILHFANPPPVSQVCKLLRQEALPLFFQAFEFKLIVSWNPVTSFCISPFQFFDALADDHVAMIRTLHLRIRAYFPEDHAEWLYVTNLDVRINIGVGDRATTCSLGQGDEVQKFWKRHKHAFEAQLQNYMTTMSARPAGERLLKSDVEAIVSIFDDPVFKR